MKYNYLMDVREDNLTQISINFLGADVPWQVITDTISEIKRELVLDCMDMIIYHPSELNYIRGENDDGGLPGLIHVWFGEKYDTKDLTEYVLDHASRHMELV